MRHRLLSFACFLFLAFFAGCSQRAELRQEVAAANELLPAKLTLGIIANSIEISGDDLVFNVTIDDNYFSDVDFDDPQHIEYMQMLFDMSLVYGDGALLRELKRSGCDVVFRATLLNDGRQLEWRVTNDRLRDLS